MKHLLFLVLTAAMAFGQQPTLKEQALPAIKGSILLPDGWHLKEESEDGVIVYQMSREKAESEEEIFSTGLILSVTTKVPDRASVKPSQYAHDLLTSAQEEGEGGKLEKTQEGPLDALDVADVFAQVCPQPRVGLSADEPKVDHRLRL